jgi:2,4-dienoyl-CoA reductase-like NADH-dependent reductase (Old Yellow Enzyme family)
VLKAIRAYSSIKVGIQLAHAGRKASSRAPWERGQQLPIAEGGWRTSAPSALALNPQEETPAALDADGLDRIRTGFVAAARRAVRLGLEVIELHGAHGYLLHEFLSPLSNQRNDGYGGTLEGRMRFPIEVFEAVREAVPDRPVGIRVSATDWVPGGWDLEQTVTFAKALKARGCDFIDVSSGGLSSAQVIPLAPNYQVPFAARIKQDVGMPTMAVGLITDAAEAEDILERGDADMIAMARGMLYDPRWPWHAAAKLGGQVKAPKQYWRSQPRDQKALFGETTLGQR